MSHSLRLRHLILIIAPLFILGACSRNSAGEFMTIEPGEEGIFIAVGAESTAKVKGQSAEIQMKKAKTAGLSIGTGVGGGHESEKNESQLFVPASITKVVTAALVLRELGKDFRFRHDVSWDVSGDVSGDESDPPGVVRDLTVVANGDPQIGPQRLAAMVREIKALGIKKVVGRVILISNDQRKDQAAPPFGMDAEDNLACFGARAQAFNYSRNCTGLVVSGLNQAQWLSAGVQEPVQLQLVAGKERRLRVIPIFSELESLVGYVIRGVWPSAGKPMTYGLPVANVKGWFGNALMTEFRKQGIDISEAPLALPSAEDAHVFLQAQTQRPSRTISASDSAEVLIRLMNKPSDNFVADALFRLLAERDSERDIRRAGANVVRKGIEEWLTRAGHPEYVSEITLTEGAGLSRLNKVSPRAFLALLQEFSKEPEFKALWDSLPIAGVDGTLKGRMINTAAHAKVRAKTGTLRGAYQLAGYIPRYRRGGTIKDYVPFVILSAVSPQNRHQVRALQDRLVARLAEELNSQN